jgi:hypothetical protein
MAGTGPLWGGAYDVGDSYFRCQPCGRLLTVEEDKKYGKHCLCCGVLATRITRSCQDARRY